MVDPPFFKQLRCVKKGHSWGYDKKGPACRLSDGHLPDVNFIGESIDDLEEFMEGALEEANERKAHRAGEDDEEGEDEENGEGDEDDEDDDEEDDDEDEDDGEEDDEEEA